jgi:hypothetical protein
MTPAAVLFALAALAGSAKADGIIYDTFVQVNIYYGVSQLYSPADVLLSTTVDMTVETQYDYAAVVAAGLGSTTTYFMPLMDQVVEEQLPGSTPAIPSYILTNLTSFANSDGFGAADDTATSVYPPDPNNSPSPSAVALYQALTTQPVPFTVTSDTGFVLLGANFDYVFGYGPFGPVPGSVDDTVVGTTNVEIFERDLTLQQTTTPEPGSLSLLAIAVGWILWKHRQGRCIDHS